jgi:hypothetical protein
VAVLSCTSHGLGDLALLVSAPVLAGGSPNLSSDVDVGPVDGCERNAATGGHVLLLCGAVGGGQTRSASVSVVPRQMWGSAGQLTVTALDLAGGGPSNPRVVDAVTTSLQIGMTSGGLPAWFGWVSVLLALVAGIDMARRSRGGFRWAIGVLVFNVLGGLVWIRDRALWEVVPAGSPPVPAPEPPWARRYSVTVAVAVPVVILGLVVFGVVAATTASPVSGGGPVAAPAPTALPVLSPRPAAAPTPCASGALPPAAASATRVVVLCGGAPSEAIVLRPGDTLALVLPTGDVGAGSTVQVVSQDGTGELIDTGLGTASAALLVARHDGDATVRVSSVCPPLSTECAGGSASDFSFRVHVGAP